MDSSRIATRATWHCQEHHNSNNNTNMSIDIAAAVEQHGIEKSIGTVVAARTT